MGDEEFDELLQRVANGPSRRGILRGGLAGLGAALGGVLQSDGVEALRRKQKQRSQRRADAKKRKQDQRLDARNNKNKKPSSGGQGGQSDEPLDVPSPDEITKEDVQAEGILCDIPWVRERFPNLCNRRKKKKKGGGNKGGGKNKHGCGGRCKKDERCIKGKCRKKPVS